MPGGGINSHPIHRVREPSALLYSVNPSLWVEDEAVQIIRRYGVEHVLEVRPVRFISILECGLQTSQGDDRHYLYLTKNGPSAAPAPSVISPIPGSPGRMPTSNKCAAAPSVCVTTFVSPTVSGTIFDGASMMSIGLISVSLRGSFLALTYYCACFVS